MVFHSSGTTGQERSRHYHGAESLALYEASLWGWFEPHLLAARPPGLKFLSLVPSRASAPHSSLAFMVDAVNRLGFNGEGVLGATVAANGDWTVEFKVLEEALENAIALGRPVLILSTAFALVQLQDELIVRRKHYVLPPGSRVMETGGYKGRSRVLSREQLRGLIQERLGVAAALVISEYGMSELSSQAYDGVVGGPGRPRRFQFPPWARGLVVSPATGREVAEGETGLIQVCDLANACSAVMVRTEDLGVRRGLELELVGRAQQAEPRGCSLMSQDQAEVNR
jgi:hypothetical protein